MPIAANPRNSGLFSRTEPVVCGNGSARSASAQRPNDALALAGCASFPRIPLPAGGHAARNAWLQSPPGPVSLRNPHQGRGFRSGGPAPAAVPPRSGPGSAPEVLRRGRGLRWRLLTAGFHARRRADCACSLFFPRSVGFGPTASCAKGALTMPPSRLCHRHAIPSRSSYSDRPLRHRRTKTPAAAHKRKYLWMELALPKRSSGNAFHWQPVRNTYTIPSNTFRESRGLRPPPGFRRYCRSFSRFGFGITGSTSPHSSSDTVHDRIALMPGEYCKKPMKRQLIIYG